MFLKALRWIGIALVVVLVALQLVPYGRRHVNPPGRVEPPWDAPATQALAVRACYDCHSHDTVWPWCSHVAPMSWLAQRDVDEGRRKLYFAKGRLPPWFYVALHPDARLTAQETRALIGGLEATLGKEERR